MNIEKLHDSYQSTFPLAERFRTALCDQVLELLASNEITLGVPIESRVKSWSSLADKVERKALNPDRVVDLHDLVGVRLILLFRRDVQNICDLIRQNFVVISSEDTALRLSESQFGYQSLHYIIKLRADWLVIPTFHNLHELHAEIQVRTLAQHIWAASSHKLQYKQEESVPGPVKRSIHRVSALLETVDLEFDRVLADRGSYLRSIEEGSGNEELNVDLLARVLDELLPLGNKKPGEEPYADVLNELIHFKIRTERDLRGLLDRNLKTALSEDVHKVGSRREFGETYGTSKERTKAGVYYSHVGLVRVAAAKEFGGAFWKYSRTLKEKTPPNTAPPADG